MVDVNEAMQIIKENLCSGEAKGRHIVVLHRGWVFVGDLTKLDNGYLLNNCGNIRKWTSGGFGGLTKSKADSGAVVDPCNAIKFKDDAMIFCVPVSGDWA
jgi:hypothetical protein